MHTHAPADEKASGGPIVCTGSCHSCGAAAAGFDSGSPSSIRGARMGWAATIVFLVPLGAAIAGAHLGGSDGGGQIGGAFIGLLAGVLVAQLLVACSRALREAAS